MIHLSKPFAALGICGALCSVPASSAVASQVTFNGHVVHVSTTGNDITGNGSATAPYYSINRAVGQGLADTSMSDTLFVLIEHGEYIMQEPLSILSPSKRPIVIRSTGKEKPRLMGGVRITGWQRCKNGMYKAYVPEVARFGFGFEQFYVNGHRATLARTPNDKWYFVKGSHEQPFVKGIRNASFAMQRIDFKTEDWATLANIPKKDLANLKFRFYHKWDITTKRPHDIEKDSACIYTAGQGMKPWNPIGRNTRYYMYDYMAALDAPGEWYLDREHATIYYMPREGEDMQEALCIAPALEHWVVLRGRPGQPVKNVTFKNISFQYSAYAVPSMGEEPEQAAASSKAAMQFDFADSIVLNDCEMMHTGTYAVWLGQECHGNSIVHCYLADLGAGGIKVGEPYFRTSMDNVTGHNLIDNNIITSTGHELPCGVGIAMLHTADNTITHNEISDLLYSGISVGWVWGYNQWPAVWTNTINEDGQMIPMQKKLVSPSVRNIVMYNHIHHIGWGELSDMGAVYTLGESHGTRISNNVIHDVYSYDYGGWGLYTDEGSTGVEMSNNLVYRCKSGGFHQHYGKDNRIENNILAMATSNQLQCTRAEGHRSFTFRHNIVLTNGEQLFRGSWGTADIATDHNLYWDMSGKQDFCGKDFKTWKKEKEPHSVYADPGMKSPLEGDFSFLSRSAARKVGYKPVDFSKVGVYGDDAWIEKARLPQERQDEFTRLVKALTSK